jgi:hypothetical protein
MKTLKTFDLYTESSNFKTIFKTLTATTVLESEYIQNIHTQDNWVFICIGSEETGLYHVEVQKYNDNEFQYYQTITPSTQAVYLFGLFMRSNSTTLILTGNDDNSGGIFSFTLNNGKWSDKPVASFKYPKGEMIITESGATPGLPFLFYIQTDSIEVEPKLIDRQYVNIIQYNFKTNVFSNNNQKFELPDTHNSTFSDTRVISTDLDFSLFELFVYNYANTGGETIVYTWNPKVEKG